MTITRRAFMKGGAMAVVGTAALPSFLTRAAFGADSNGQNKRLVVIFQRGAADGLNIVVPHGERSYYAMRPSIAIQQKDVVDLDGFFGLHPSMQSLKPVWDQGHLAIVHAAGSPDPTRSHFDAQDYMASGTPDVKSTPDGWLNRYLATKGTCEECASRGSVRSSPFQAVAMTDQTPRILEGSAPAVAMTSLEAFTVRAGGTSAEQIEALYRTGSSDVVHASGSEMFDAVKMLRAANPQRYQPENGADYPRSQFGQRLREIAQLIKADVGMEIAFADVGGWDTHVNQGGATGQLAARLRDFAASIAAFTTDLGPRLDDVVILTMSEFGRTARQNGTGGTDHGHAGAMFAIGGAVAGRRVHGRWPGLAAEQLYEGRDLALTTDFRAVFGEVLTRHMGAASTERIFPGFAATSGNRPGVVRG
jgi:uncharacterized protein (DUF1501 family)